MPPIPIPEYALRGLMGRIARSEDKDIDAVGPKDVNAIRDAERYAEIQPASSWAPNGEMRAIVKKLYDGPFPTNLLRPYSFEYWYNYFFIELNKTKDKSHYATAVIRPDGSLYSEADLPRKRELLQGMLEIGFEKFTVADHLDAQALAIQIHKRKQELSRDVVVFFRGDGRSWPRIRADNGCKAQSRVARLRIERGMDNDWHPFKKSGTDVWYRRGHSDACLFSAVSVSPLFEIATSFPLLAELKAQNPGAVGHSIAVVRTGGIDAVKHLDATRANVYAIRAKGAYDTQAKQQKVGNFPEFASDELEWTDHLIWFSVIRIHFPDHGGHLAVIDDFRFLQPDEVCDRLLGAHAAGQLKQWALETVRKGKVSGESQGIPCYPLVDNKPVAPVDFMVVKVLNAFIPGPPKT